MPSFSPTSLTSILSPTSIAVIGASATEGKVGHDILKNLLTQGYRGNVFPVNPKGGTILGREVFPTIDAIPSAVDLAVIVIPAVGVPEAVEACGKKSVKSVIVISAGFGETGSDEGHRQEGELLAIAEKYRMPLVGPNCLGVVRPKIGMNASFAASLPKAGNVAFISQSGATAVALMDIAPLYGIGFSAVMSIGNKTVLDEADYLELLGDDPETAVIGLYLESFKEGRRFFKVASAVSKRKPIVLLKAGRTTAGAKAAASHTGALAGSDAAIKALCIQAGIHRADTSEGFFDALAALSMQPPLMSDQIAIITNAGGPGILATDACAMLPSLSLPALPHTLAASLAKNLPSAASVKNPIDVLGDAPAERYRAALDTVAESKDHDGAVVLLTPQVMTPVDEIAESLIQWRETHPTLPVITSFMGGASVAKAVATLTAHRIPSPATPERAIRAMRALRERGMILEYWKSAAARPTVTAPGISCPIGAPGLLSEDEAASLISSIGISLPAQSIATSADEAMAMAEKIGFPVILKVSSKDIVHKTDCGGVRARLMTAKAVRSAFEEIMVNARSAYPQAKIRGVLVQKMIPPGHECIVGMVRDESFGPLIMVGLGGIFAEVVKDAVFRIAPLSESDAIAMLHELVTWPILAGARGQKPVDVQSLAHVVVALGELSLRCSRIREIDFNPVIVSEDGAIVADAKVILG